MVNSSRRRILMLAGLSAVAGSAMVGGALPLAAQQGKPVVGLRYQNFKRGTIHSLDPATRGLVIVWEDLGRVKLKAADLVTNYAPGGTKEKTDPTTYTIDIVNPASGEVLQTPQIRTEAGLAALRTLKPGDPVTTVFSIQTAIKITVVR